VVAAGCEGRRPSNGAPVAAPVAAERTVAPAETSPAVPPPGAGERPPAASEESRPAVGAERGGADEPPPIATAPEPAPPPDLDTAYADVLASIVTETGLVRYERLADPAVRAKLEAVVAAFQAKEVPVETSARIALWCNAYNANVLAAALRASRMPGFTTVKDVPGFFDRAPIVVAGETLTLNDLENARLRPLGDARVHAALVCGAVSCPPLRREPFEADRLDEQLADQCRRWVNDPGKFRVIDGRLGLSEIMRWYEGDFKGPPYGNATGFVLAYAEPAGPLARLIINSEKVETTWIPYDWRLNQAPAE
jgi:hypothetical protein